MTGETHVIQAPDKSRAAVLTYVGEIRFGPPYYSLGIGEIDFGERIFGNSSLWSNNSRFFAIQEWLSTQERSGPRTLLIVVEPAAGRECIVSGAEHGFIEPKAFESQQIIYVKNYFAPGVQREFESNFLDLPRWQPLQKMRRLP